MIGWWKNQGLNFKVATAIILTMVIVLGLAFLAVSEYIRDRLWNSELQKLENINAVANTLIADAMMAGSKEKIDDAISKLGQNVANRQLNSIAVYDEQNILTAFASGFPGGVAVRRESMPNKTIDDPSCWGCHQFPTEVRPSHLVIYVEGKQVIRNSVALVNEERCQTCHGTGVQLLGDVIVDYSMEQFTQSYNTIMAGIGSGIVLAVSLVTLVLFQTTRRIVLNPIAEMADTMKLGDLERQIPIRSNDEVGVLASALNNLTAQLRSLIENLEKRVADRTRALEISATISQRLSTIVDLQELLVTVVEEVKKAFGYYHAHIYLLDERSNTLIMAGGTGEPARIMLQQGHKIAVGRGLVGQAAAAKKVIFASDTSREKNWLPNPLLPDTRSEVAIPIVTSDQILGVLDVQHNIVNGLEEADIQLLQSISDQVAVAVQKARLYTILEEQAEKETLINMIGRRIQSAQSVDSVMQVAIQELQRAFGAQKARISLNPPAELENATSSQKQHSG